MVSVSDALKIMLDSVKPLQNQEEISILEARGRVLAEDIFAAENIPPFNNSAMDGYALRSEDVKQAAKGDDVSLKIIGEIQAGGDFQGKKITQGTAIRIMTGAPMPDGADAVVMVEETREKDDFVYLARSINKKENVRFAGEDLPKGGKVLDKGEVLKSADIGLLASLNHQKINVYPKPKVAIISTGDELVDLGVPLPPGKIRNSNAFTLYSEVLKYNGLPYYLGIAKDTKEATLKKIKEALDYDIIITSGGVSMGQYDFVKEVLLDLGFDLKIKKIKMKPGKPLAFGVKGKSVFFGLPGNPVSTLIAFIEFVRPVLLKFMGNSSYEKPLVEAILDDELVKKPERLHFVRGCFRIKEGKIHVKVTGAQGSGILKSMSKANCLIILKEGLKLVRQGELVPIQLINHEEL